MKTPYEIYQEMEGAFDETDFENNNSGGDIGGYHWRLRQKQIVKNIKSKRRNSLVNVLKALEGQIEARKIKNFIACADFETGPKQIAGQEGFNQGLDSAITLITDLIANLEK